MSEESLSTAADPLRCTSCAAPLAVDQRYCLECGARVGRVPPPAFEPAAAAIVAPTVARPRSVPRLPSPRTAATLTLLVLGFGIVVGAAATPGGDTFAAGSASITVAVAPSAPPPAPAVRPQPSFEAPAPPSEVTEAPAAPVETSAPSEKKAPAAKLAATHPPIKHVFLVVLADQRFYDAFGPSSKAPYLAHTLRDQGALLTHYYAVAHDALANGIALVSGQGPNPDTQANCPTYVNVAPGRIAHDGQEHGAGCVYSTRTMTLADQLAAKSLGWKAYVEDIGAGAPGTAQTCRHPAPDQSDQSAQAWSGDAYATWRNPFVYFHTIVDSPDCESRDVGLDALATDIKNEHTTPAFSYVVPDLCHDGRDAPCAEGQTGGLASADAFLSEWIPKIMESPAYLDDGLIVITFDQAPASGPSADSRACCRRPELPNVDDAGGPAAPGPRGGRVGALLLSRYVDAGAKVGVPYDHYSLLRSIEDIFDLDPLGYAGARGVKGFDKRVYGAWSPR